MTSSRVSWQLGIKILWIFKNFIVNFESGLNLLKLVEIVRTDFMGLQRLIIVSRKRILPPGAGGGVQGSDWRANSLII